MSMGLVLVEVVEQRVITRISMLVKEVKCLQEVCTAPVVEDGAVVGWWWLRES